MGFSLLSYLEQNDTGAVAGQFDLPAMSRSKRSHLHLEILLACMLHEDGGAEGRQN